MTHKNIIIIIADCLRPDVIELNTYKGPLMPNLRSIKKDSAYFNNAFASAPSTHFAVPTILTGNLPLTFTDFQGIMKNAKYIPSFFKENGYHTWGVSANPVTSKMFGYARGFDKYIDFLDKKHYPISFKVRKRIIRMIERLSGSEHKTHRFMSHSIQKFLKMTKIKINPETTNYSLDLSIDGGKIIEQLEQNIKYNEPFFGFTHFIDTHAPYAPPNEFLNTFITKSKTKNDYMEEFFFKTYKNPELILNKNDLKKLNWNYYLASCQYQDYLIEKIFEILKNKNVLNNTIIIIMSDHGESFGEHGYLQHPRNRHNIEQIKIPFLVYGYKRKGLMDNQIDELDIFPLVQKIAGLKGRNPGKNPFDTKEKITATIGYSGTYSLTTNKIRYINDELGKRIYKRTDVNESNPIFPSKDTIKILDQQVNNLIKKGGRSKRKEVVIKKTADNIRKIEEL